MVDNGWNGRIGWPEDAKEVNTDDYGNVILEGEAYYEDSEFGVMSDETFHSYVKSLKTDFDRVAEKPIIDDWNGETINVGERYLALADGSCKVFDDTRICDVTTNCQKFVA